MASKTASNVMSQAATSSLFNRGINAFDDNNRLSDNIGNMNMLPPPNSPSPITSGGSNQQPSNNTVTTGKRSPGGPCNFHDMEYAVNQRYRYNTNCHKNLKTLQQTIGEKKRPCLFDAARIFGGSECTQEVFNGICSFHWSMLNLRVGVCEQYNTNNKSNGSFQHYEMLVDVSIPDRALVPIFPNISSSTSMWDLMFGFTYATNRGLAVTKLNEGAAMAYALYYMMDNHCYVEFLARSTYWVQNMTEYLMAFVFYNDELLKDVYASRFPVEQDATNTMRTVLKNMFTKNVYVQDLTFNVDRPKIHLPAGMADGLSEKDSRIVRNLPPLSNDGVTSNADTVETSSPRTDHRSISYKHFHIFVAPLILSLRSSSYVSDIFTYAAPPVIGAFNIRFKDSSPELKNGHSVFAIQGPIQYGTAVTRGDRRLPFTSDMPVCTQAYVATLGGVSNIDVNEDRIFGSELARFADFSIPDSDQLFTVGNLR